MKHPLSPPTRSKIKPPYIPPPPKHTMNKPTLWLPTIKRYDDGFTIPSMTEAQHAGYVSYPDYLEIKAKADALDAEVKAMWKENYELRTGRAYCLEEVVIIAAGVMGLTLLIAAYAL